LRTGELEAALASMRWQSLDGASRSYGTDSEKDLLRGIAMDFTDLDGTVFGWAATRVEGGLGPRDPGQRLRKSIEAENTVLSPTLVSTSNATKVDERRSLRELCKLTP